MKATKVEREHVAGFTTPIAVFTLCLVLSLCLVLLLDLEFNILRQAHTGVGHTPLHVYTQDANCGGSTHQWNTGSFPCCSGDSLLKQCKIRIAFVSPQKALRPNCQFGGQWIKEREISMFCQILLHYAPRIVLKNPNISEL